MPSDQKNKKCKLCERLEKDHTYAESLRCFSILAAILCS